jgi:hypothetical protein
MVAEGYSRIPAVLPTKGINPANPILPAAVGVFLIAAPVVKLRPCCCNTRLPVRNLEILIG